MIKSSYKIEQNIEHSLSTKPKYYNFKVTPEIDNLFLKIKDYEFMFNNLHLDDNKTFELLVKSYFAQSIPNDKQVLKFAGVISDEEAKQVRDTINKEFNTIEGEW